MRNAMISRRSQKILVILSAMAGLAVLNFNCSPSAFESSKYEGSSEGTLDIYAAAKNSPIVLMTAKQTYQSMLNVTGQSTSQTRAQLDEYDLRFGTLASTANITNLTAPLQMAATSLAGSVCDGLIIKESAVGAVRKFFIGVDFTKAPSGTPVAVWTNSVNVMALAFYGRALNADETALMSQFYKDFTTGLGNTVADTRKLYLATCTSMLASFDVYTY